LQEGLRAIGDTEVLKKIVSPDCKLSVRRQCELLGLNRSSIYYKPVEESAEDLDLMLKMDKEYHEHPTYGSYGHLSREKSQQVGDGKIHSFIQTQRVRHNTFKPGLVH